MKTILKLIDDQYPKSEKTHSRSVARGIVIDDDGRIALHHLFRDDKFGHRDYYETPGGGVKQYETLTMALKRELKEELGVTVKDIRPIGKVIDFYNLLNQKNLNNYFYCRVESFGASHLQLRESALIESTHWVSFDEAISLYEKMNKEPLEILVRRRELPIILIAKKMFEGK